MAVRSRVQAPPTEPAQCLKGCLMIQNICFLVAGKEHLIPILKDLNFRVSCWSSVSTKRKKKSGTMVLLKEYGTCNILYLPRQISIRSLSLNLNPLEAF